MAEDKGIDISTVTGSGPGGRIVKADIENYSPPAQQPAPSREGAPVAAQLPAMPVRKVPEGPDVEIMDVSRMRQRIATNTIESKQQIPHFYVTTEIDVEPMLALRKQINADLEADGIKVSVNDMIVKAAAVTLRQFPNLNTHYYGDKLVHHQRINIGIAVALDNGGLINVVAKDADTMPLSELSERNKAMIARAREGRVKPEDVQGSTFTTSNLGPFGVDHFAAIINPPEAGIIAVGTAKKVPVVMEDGTLGVGNRMKVTISVDHRVSDGAEGAAYLQQFRNVLENPMRMLL
jgi:pyruvate dehydrogenase E2 component (dihydrolipoamide acetyltransferase)